MWQSLSIHKVETPAGASQMRLMMVLSLLLLMMAYGILPVKMAEIFDCNSTDAQTQALHFALGSQFALCCRIKGAFCNTTTFNDTLTLLPNGNKNDESNGDQSMTRLEPCLVKYEVNNASSDDQTMYSCKLNGEEHVQEEVWIIKNPIEPVIISFTCTPDKVITVVFDRGTPSTEYRDDYEVTMTENQYGGLSSRLVTVCNSTYNKYNCSGSLCTCVYTEATTEYEYKLPADISVMITVTAKRSVVVKEVSKDYFVMANILPGPLVQFEILNVSSSDAFVQFCIRSMNTKRLLRFMKNKRKPLQHNLWVLTKQGVPEILYVNLPSTVGSLCIHVHLINLIPFTNYDVVISSSGGGGEGIRSRANFTTDMTKPAYPPLVNEFSFMRLDRVINGTQTDILVLMWKPLPHAAVGGSISYYVNVSAGSDFSLLEVSSETYAMFSVSGVPDGLLTAKIWSQNEVGHSQNFTKLEIPQNKDMPDAFVELNRDKAVVYINLDDLNSNTVLAIQWCSNYTNNREYGVDICQEYPDTVNFTINPADGKVQKFEFDINKDKKPRETTEYRIIQYSDLKSLCSTPIKMTANATVNITSDENVQKMLQYDLYLSPSFPGEDVTYCVDDQKKRNVEVDAMRSVTGRQPQSSKAANESRESPSPSRYKFFISLKREDGLWHSGMVPVDCYFNKSKAEVKLTVSQEIADATDVLLRWRQECEKDSPTQFLADYFQVYSSTEEYCIKDKKLIGEVKNNVFEPNVMKLPKDTKFACISAHRIDSHDDWTSKLHIEAINHPSDSGFRWPYFVGVAVSIAVLFFVAITIVLWCVCRRRKLRMTKLMGSMTLPEKKAEPNSPHSLNGDIPPDVRGRTILDHGSTSFSSTDSGRGTGPCEADSGSGKKTHVTDSMGNVFSSSSAISNTQNPVHSSSDKPANTFLSSSVNLPTDICTVEMGTSGSQKSDIVMSSSSRGEDYSNNFEESDSSSKENDESEEDLEQLEILKVFGCSFNNRTSGSSCSDEADAPVDLLDTAESDAATESSRSQGNLPEIRRPAMHIVHRMMSSESESDGSDSSERPLISLRSYSITERDESEKFC